MIKSFKDLEIYQESYQLALEIYKISRGYPPEERYGLTSQIQRCVMSIPLNIAEGYGKHESAAEFKRYLRMALGSAQEMKVLIDFSRDLGYMPEGDAARYHERYDILAKRIYRTNEKWEKKSSP